jgi:hypothetical protein
MTATNLRARLDAALATGMAGAPLEDLITEGYAVALRLDAEALALRRRANRLAGAAEDPARLHELRRVLERRARLTSEREELRAVLRRLEAMHGGGAAVAS